MFRKKKKSLVKPKKKKEKRKKGKHPGKQNAIKEVAT